MTPASAPVAAPIGIWRWDSPMPYLFAGLSIMLGLIALSLIILLYAYCKQMRQPVDVDIEKSVRPMVVLPPAEFEPKIAVIMAGDDTPRFLLKPMPPSSSTQPSVHIHNQQEV